MTFFDVKALPANIPRMEFEALLKPLSRLSVFKDKKRVVLEYLGGITNHGLKAPKEKLFIRIPGHNANYFVNRKAELTVLKQLAAEKLYPSIIEAYTEGDLAGYKVEPLIEGETLQFDGFSAHQIKVLSALKALHDAKIVFKKRYDIFEELLSMCDALLTHQKTTLPFLSNKKIEGFDIARVQAYIHELQTIKQSRFPDTRPLSPCHNDITPTNFIYLNQPYHGQQYQLIDWEYAGMNDRLYDVAGVAAMLGMTFKASEALVLAYFQSSDNEKHEADMHRVQFYMPIVKLYYAVWAALQVATGNASSSIDELKSGWGPGSLTIFLEQYHTDTYQALIGKIKKIKSHAT